MKPRDLVYNGLLGGQRMSHKHDKDLNRLRELSPSMREKAVRINLDIFMSKISKHQRIFFFLLIRNIEAEQHSLVTIW